MHDIYMNFGDISVLRLHRWSVTLWWGPYYWCSLSAGPFAQQTFACCIEYCKEYECRFIFLRKCSPFSSWLLKNGFDDIFLCNNSITFVRSSVNWKLAAYNIWDISVVRGVLKKLREFSFIVKIFIHSSTLLLSPSK